MKRIKNFIHNNIGLITGIFVWLAIVVPCVLLTKAICDSDLPLWLKILVLK